MNAWKNPGNGIEIKGLQKLLASASLTHQTHQIIWGSLLDGAALTYG
jgi:hypothetical protein